MRLNTFQAIRFSREYWDSLGTSLFEANGNSDKIKKTEDILDFLNIQITKGNARIDSTPGLYVLRMTSGSKSVVSVIGEVDYNEKSLLFMNEEVHKDKLESYKTMFNRYKIQTNPILTFYKGGASIRSITSNILEFEPSTYAMVGGTSYELWHVKDPIEVNRIKGCLLDVNRLYIADGHHRFSIFSSLFSKLSAKLVISVTDSNSMLLKSCHRIILGKVSPDWLTRISQFGSIERVSAPAEVGNKTILSFRSGENFAISLREKTPGKNLYEIVRRDIIEFALGIRDYENRIFPLPGNITPSDTDKIFNLYQNGSVVVFIPSIGISDFFEAIDNGHKLPATSTWFKPKIVDGFIVRKF